jgi:GT2 family glycosyltransferase
VNAEVRLGIVVWNTAAELERCLAAVPAALGSLTTEVVVVDNASADGSADVAERAGVTVVRNPTNVGYAAAMNQALDGASAPVLIALNPDTVPPPGSLARLVETLRARPTVGIVVPALANDDGSHQHSALRFPTPLPSLVAAVSTAGLRRSGVGRRLLLDGAPAPESGEVPWAIGAVHVIRADALAGEAPYDEQTFMYAEDLDLCWRLQQRGRPTWLDATVIVPHVGNVAGAQAWGDTRSQRYWAATYPVVARRRSSAAARVLAVAAVVAAVIAAVRSLPGALRPGAQRHQLRMRARELRTHLRAIANPTTPQTRP